ncbi:MAG: sensor histidine kinase [Planctomycetota bacterium]
MPLAAVMDATPGALLLIDLEGIVFESNAAAGALFGYAREEAVGRRFEELFVPERLRESARIHLASYRSSGQSQVIGRHFDALAVKADGSEFPVEVTVNPVSSADSPLLLLSLQDASPPRPTGRRLPAYQDRLRSLAAQLLLVEETERRRLAVDLHDGLSQTLALARLKSAEFKSSGDVSLVEQIAKLIEEAETCARSVTFELSPPSLHDLGLVPALEWLADNIRDRYGLDVRLEDDGQPKPAGSQTRVILFRAVRELLINAAKHARANHVRLQLRREDDLLHAVVEDDGVGMKPGTASVKGYGLFSIRERIGHVGGGMKVESAPARGTKIRVWAPVEDAGTHPPEAKA